MQARKLLALAVIAAVVVVPSAQAHKGDGWKVVASGLDNPRGLDVAKNGDIWIAESGKGGAGPCVPNEDPDGAPVCFGLSGAFTVVHKGKQQRVVSGLPSFATEGIGDDAEGPVDIVVNGKRVTGLIGGGHSPDKRAVLGTDGALFGHVVKVDPWKGGVWPFADITQYEGDNNPDGGEVDSNPNGIAVRHGGYVVADAGGNSVLGVSHKKAISTLAVFPDTMVDAPPFLGMPAGSKIPMQAVPTTVAVRPKDPNVYVGQLTGFPFPVGGASVWAVAPDGTKTVYAAGFTNIIDIAWGPKGSLYVLEITANGILSGDRTGALIRVWPNGKRTVVASDGLVTPAGVAIGKDGSVYVSNYSTSAGKGTVVNIGKV